MTDEVYKKRSRRQIEAYIETKVNELSDFDIIKEISKDGLSEAEIIDLIEGKRNRKQTANIWFIVIGIAVFFIGVLLTKASYESVSYSGGTYFVYYGLMITGPITAIIGISRMMFRK